MRPIDGDNCDTRNESILGSNFDSSETPDSVLQSDKANDRDGTLQGLPTDELSIQNGILVTRAARYPLLIDPQGQGRTWLKAREAANNLKTTTLSDKHFRNHLEVHLLLQASWI